jgi:hypothetical protein
MLAKFRVHLRHNVVGYLALFVALGGTGAYAANEWTGANIVDSSLTGADVKGKQGNSTTAAVNGSLTTDDIAGQQANAANGTPFVEGTLTQWDLKNNTVTGSDVLESSLTKVPDADKLDGIDSTGLVQGRGTLLSNRIVFLPGTGLYRTFLQIPGLGELKAGCFSDGADILWSNTTGGPVDFWYQFNGHVVARVASANDFNAVASIGSSLSEPGAFVGLGVGNDPGSRRVATLNVFVYQSADGAPCGFQAQGTLWVSP